MTDDSGRNKEVVQAFADAINARDWAGLDRTVAPDFVRHGSAAPPVRSRDELKAYLRGEFETFPDAVETVVDMVAEGDRVAVRHRFHGTQLGALGPYPPSGKVMTADYLAIYRLECGLIVEAWAEWDNLNGLTQLGHYRAPDERMHVASDAPVLINIDVDDMERASAFYCAALGLRVGRRFGKAAVELLGGTSAIYLLRKAAGTAASSVTPDRRRYERHWTPVHLDFVVPQIGVAIERAVAAGARLEGEAQTHPWGHLAAMADPFGHGFCLIEFLNRGYDEIAT